MERSSLSDKLIDGGFEKLAYRTLIDEIRKMASSSILRGVKTLQWTGLPCLCLSATGVQVLAIHHCAIFFFVSLRTEIMRALKHPSSY